ncbi:MAG: hypothetical protein PHU44_13685 [Syntrophales bacterium]|nr:hypothetical protein [Syntrophales bacterium]
MKEQRSPSQNGYPDLDHQWSPSPLSYGKDDQFFLLKECGKALWVIYFLVVS